MSLLRELRSEIRRYLAGESSIKTLDHWIGARVQAIMDSDCPKLRDLCLFTWTLIDYWMVGDVDEEWVRTELGAT